MTIDEMLADARARLRRLDPAVAVFASWLWLSIAAVIDVNSTSSDLLS